MPFANHYERDIHFQKHRHEFQAQDADEYERMADAFMSARRSPDIMQCFRRGGEDQVRLSYSTRYFGVARISPEPGYIKTFHIVDEQKIRRHGDIFQYFRFECNRVDV